MGSVALEVAIGLVFTFLVLSLICSVLSELLAGLLSLRAINLQRGIQSLLSDSSDPNGNPLANLIYKHGLVQGLFRDSMPDKLRLTISIFGTTLPSYIPATTFTSALLDVVAPANGQSRTIEQVRASTLQLPDSKAKQALLSLIADSGTSIEVFRHRVERWFDDSMDRAAGWYKRKTQVIILVLALLVTIATNTDTLRLATSLWRDAALRQATVELAEDYAKKQTSAAEKQPDLGDSLEKIQQLKSKLPAPIGWSTLDRPLASSERPSRKAVLFGYAATGLGWLFTVLAISLGAPFWFDVLNKFMSVRSTIKPREKSPEEASKD
jgi:hypothetical protein